MKAANACQGRRYRLQRMEHGSGHRRRRNRLDADLAPECAPNRRHVDEDTNVTPIYYLFRDFSQFVTWAKVVATSGGDAIAFNNPDGSVAVVVVHQLGVDGDDDRDERGRDLRFVTPPNGWTTVVAR
jgi:hypothetical protein